MQLYKDDGTPINNADIYVEFIYDTKKEDIRVCCRDIPPSYNSPEQALRELLCVCEDSLLFRLDSKIEYCPEATLGYIDGKDDPININGYFIALSHSGDETVIITNTPAATVFMGCAEFLASYFTKNRHFSKYVKTAVEYLKQRYRTEVKKKSTMSSFARELFNNGDAAVKCSSREEYEDFVIWLIGKGYHISETLNPLSWDGLTKYIICKKENKEVYATHRLENGIETILKCSAILKKYR